MVRDLRWLGLDWDEGPDVGGPHAPYRQSERAHIYVEAAQKLVKEGKAYPCFCTEEELEAMKAAAEAAKLPPKYTGKWASASQAEVDAALASGLTPVYRFRVPPDARVVIQDAIRGEVSWATDAVGDFVLVRSNGLPVYNFCVAVDDAMMRITHVLRAEEHLPNTLRQVLVYDALGYTPPTFGHVSLILAPDRSKLSKRHGATSVGEFREQGYLPAAMNNFLALLGWNEGTTREIYALDELVDAFSLERITKSPAVFDKAKLGWVNGQHLRALPAQQAAALLGEAWAQAGLLSAGSGAFVERAAALVAPSCELVADGVDQLRGMLGYPLAAEAADEKAAPVLADGFADVAASVLASYESGALAAAVSGGPDSWKAFVKDAGKALGRKGKGLFMPMRLALTGCLHGPDIGEQLALIEAASAPGVLAQAGVVVPMEERMGALRAWLAAHK
jgi:glutamyl-tRNA synthetase